MQYYLDNAATTPINQEVLDVVIKTLKQNWYNPSSSYEKGLESKRIIENAKKIISKEINCYPEEIIFTSSGSESNALAIDGFLSANTDYEFVTTSLEHSSILMNKNIDTIEICNKLGLFSKNQFEKYQRCLVSIQGSNNEIGVINNLEAISKVLHKNQCVVHSDCTQLFGHVPIDVKKIGLDMMTISGHKINAPKGIAFLYVKRGLKLNSIIHGTQFNGIRGGTENIAFINGLAKAVELIDYEKQKYVKEMRDWLIDELMNIDGITLNGDKENRLPGNVNICIHNIKINSQQLIALLDIYGFMISAGSACHTGSSEPSHVLKAIGLSDEEAQHSIRISIGNQNTYEELKGFIKCLKNIIRQYN
ncbi:cysteine desulfurase family protein [Clostridium sp.]|uniref:cysteine desulfurase family protein n=1 Tax=Clostridium sp. TaxID=1506 RepID=UPI003216CDD5